MPAARMENEMTCVYVFVENQRSRSSPIIVWWVENEWDLCAGCPAILAL